MALHHKIPDGDKLLFNVQDAVKTQLNRGMDKAAKRLIEELQAQSHSDKKTMKNKYCKSWKISHRYRNMRVIYNTKTVPSSKGDIPLVNVLEAENSQAQRIFEEMQGELADIILNEIT